MTIRMKRVEEEERWLRSTPIRPLAGPENAFETESGKFWILPQTIPYMKATFSLAEIYWVVAGNCNVKEVFEKTLFHNLEHLRLGAVDLMGLRFQVPYILLSLNRDDDACSFILYWKLFFASVFDFDEVTETHANSQPGDWMYPRVPNIRYLDIYQQILDLKNEMQPLELSFMVVLVIVKLRIVAAHDAMTQAIELAFGEGTTGHRIQQVRSNVTDMLIRANVNVESQRRQVNRLLDDIHLHNPSMLPSIIHPDPLLKQPCPSMIPRGHPTEAYATLMYCRPYFGRVPGAIDMLKERFGTNPTYNWNTKIYN